MTGPSPRLSLVVPSYNEAHRIEPTLQRLGDFLGSQSYETELLLVDDGSDAASRAANQRALDLLPSQVDRTLLRHETNRGKGAAVRTGCLAARGRYVAFIDADLATPPEELLPLVAALEAGADVAIGVRTQRDGSDMRNKRGFMRRMAGKAYALAMRVLVLPDVSDSQCPLKAFSQASARRLFRLQRIDTWSFDAELLFLSKRLGLTVAKIPVRWQAVAGSHLRLNLKTAREVWNLLRIRWLHRGVSAR
jgi:glycosyltransferase involved in cell wall biosynthesis